MMIEYISKADELFNDITLSGAIALLMGLCSFAWVYGIFYKLPDMITRMVVVLFVYITVYSIIAPYIITLTASLLALSLVLVAWTMTKRAEEVLILLGFLALLAAVSYSIGKNLIANTLVAVTTLVSVFIVVRHGKKIDIALRMIVGSVLFSWLDVYGALYFKTNHEHGFSNTLRELYDLVGCINRYECLVHVIVSAGMTVLRLGLTLLLFKQKVDADKEREDALNAVLEDHKRRKSTTGDEEHKHNAGDDEEEEDDIDVEATRREFGLIAESDTAQDKCVTGVGSRTEESSSGL